MRRRDWLLLSVLAATACGVEPRSEDETAGATNATVDASSTGDPPTGSSAEEGSSGSSMGSTGGESGTGSDTLSDGRDTWASSSESGTSAATSGDGSPIGESCSADPECASGHCYLLPMLGACSECTSDEHCMQDGEPGTCQLDVGLGYAVCTSGGAGAQCESDAGCGEGLTCALLLDTGGLLDVSTCGYCASDSDCGGGETCSPIYADGELSGYLDCVPLGSVPDGQGCPLDANGEGVDEACASGHCGVAELPVGGGLGVCGECETSGDCGGGTCNGPSANLNGVHGAECL